MRFKKIEKGIKRVKRKFAFLPTNIYDDENDSVWLEFYYSHQESIYSPCYDRVKFVEYKRCLEVDKEWI